MVSRSSRKPSRQITAACLSAGLAVTGLTTVLTTADAGADGVTPAARSGGECRLVRLAQAERFFGGSVIDIERVGYQVVYYGSGSSLDRNGDDHQRAFIWRGRNAEPVRVGPRGFDSDTAYELTDTGLINGVSESFDGDSVAWVQDLATGELTFFDIDSGPRGADHGYANIRRINGTGAAAGVVDRSADDPFAGSDAVAFEGPDATMTLLPESQDALVAGAAGINDAGDRAGILGRESAPGFPDFLVFDPIVWETDGTVVELAHPPGGFDGIPRSLKDDGTVSGLSVWGDNPDVAHIEAAYWPAPDTFVGLGVLEGGAYSDAFGMDEGGWVVGLSERNVDEDNPFAEDGVIGYGFLRTPATSEGKLRILPSLYADRKGIKNWRKWNGGAVHAVNRDLNQAGTSTHWKFDRRGRIIGAPTVYLHADRCGREVATTHDPFHLEDGASAAPGERRIQWRHTSAMLARIAAMMTP